MLVWNPTVHYDDCPICAWAFNVTSPLQDLRSTFCMYFSNPLSHVLHAPLQLLFITVFMRVFIYLLIIHLGSASVCRIVEG